MEGGTAPNERTETREGPTRCLVTRQVGSHNRSAITADFGGRSKPPPPSVTEGTKARSTETERIRNVSHFVWHKATSVTQN